MLFLIIWMKKLVLPILSGKIAKILENRNCCAAES